MSPKYDVKKYWDWRAREGKRMNDNNLAVLTYDPEIPIKNKTMDFTQKKIMREFLKNENLKNKRILEIGCGVGRWVKIFQRTRSRLLWCRYFHRNEQHYYLKVSQHHC